MASIMLLMDYHGLFLLKGYRIFFLRLKKRLQDVFIVRIIFKTTFLFTK